MRFHVQVTSGMAAEARDNGMIVNDLLGLQVAIFVCGYQSCTYRPHAKSKMLSNHQFPGLSSTSFPGSPARPEASTSSLSRDRSPSRTFLHTGNSQRSSISDGFKDPQLDNENVSKRQRYRRSTKGCFPCRSAKVKCDETTPTCLRCKMNQRPCEWPDPEQLAHPRKSRKKSSASTPSGTPVPTSRTRDAIERDWREISALADTGRDRSVSFSMDNDLFPVSSKRICTSIPTHKLIYMRNCLQVSSLIPPSDSIFSASGSSSRPLDHLARQDLPPFSPLAQSVSRSTSYMPPDALPSLSNSVLANRRMTKGKLPMADGSGENGQGYQHGHPPAHEDSLLHGISLDSLIK